MDADAYRRAADVENFRTSRLLSGRASEETGKLVETCTGDTPPRKAPVLTMLCGCGLRRGEFARLDVEEFDPEGCWIVVQHGKRDKQRTGARTRPLCIV